MKYVVEKVKEYDDPGRDEKPKTINEYNTVEEAINIAKCIKLHKGETYIEKVRVGALDDDGEFIDYPYIRYHGEDR